MTNSVKYVWITPDSENLIAYIARVSNPKGQENKNKKGLFRYLIDNGHWSPFEMANLCVEINTTRAISAQIIRHRSFSFQEFSQRYANIVSENLAPFDGFKLRSQDFKNRQNSIDDIPAEKQAELNVKIKQAEEGCVNVYNELISNGVAKECARFILPMSTPTRIYMNGTIRSWIHYLSLRSANGTQKEHADIADEIIETIFKEHLPTIYSIIYSLKTTK